MDNIVERILSEFVIKTSEQFKLDFEDALAAVSQSKVANDLVSFGYPENRTTDELLDELFDEISNGY